MSVMKATPLSFAAPPISDEEFRSALDDAHERYGNMLRKLAE